MSGSAHGGDLDPVVRDMLAADASLAGPGIAVTSAGAGDAVATMVVGPLSLNGHARVHGGLIFMLADTAFACAANTVAAPAVTSSADITFLGSAELGETLVATASVRSQVGRQGVVDVTVRCGDRVIAEYRGRSTRIRPPNVS